MLLHAAERGVALARLRSTVLPGHALKAAMIDAAAETLALERPMRLQLTLVHADVPGDTFMPDWREMAWKETARRESADANFRYTFFTLER
jgi:dihydrofolate reductase